MTKFDMEESKRLKESGIKAAAEKRPELLKIARTIAKEIAVSQGTVTADDVAEELRDRALGDMGPAMASVFRTLDFEWTGLRVMSKQVSNHGRELKVWTTRKQGANHE
jgi:hypothetical protein